MKLRKLLSVILTLTIATTCFASMWTFNVSAHQNYSDEITFDEIDDFNVTGYKYGTGNLTRDEETAIKSIEQYTDVGKLTCFTNNAYTYVDVGTAPDARYGKSLAVHHDSVDNSTYAQISYTPGGNSATKLYNTIHMTASLYVPDAALQAQRALLFRTTENSGYRKYPVSFGYNGNRDISIFEVNSGMDYTTSKWYDFDIIYNIDTMEYHVKVWEDSTLLINQTGVDTGKKYSYVDSIILYHGPSTAARAEQVCYWDNFLVESANEFTIDDSGASASKEIFDFEDFVAQDNTAANDGIPASTRGTWALGYQGSTELELLKSVTDAKTDDMEVAPNLGKSVAFGCFDAYNEATALDGETDYLYPQFRYNFNSAAWADDFKIEFSIKLVNNGVLNLYCRGSNKCNIFRATGTNLYIFNTKYSDFSFNTTDWYDVNILIDGSTGYYNMDIKNRTSPSKPSMYCEGYNSEIISLWDNSDKIIYFQQGTSALARYVYLDNIYWGQADDDDIPQLNFEDVTATATADAEAVATTYFPFVNTESGKFVTANLTFEGTAPTFTLGSEAIDISALTPGTYPVTMKLLKGETNSVTLNIGGTSYPVTMTTLPSKLTLTAPLGEGNTASFTDVTYNTMTAFEITNDISKELFDPEDDVVINFSNAAINPSADCIKVYKPYGTINSSAEVTDKTVTFAQDGKSVTIAFDKAYDTHYHITLEGLTDAYGSVLNDFVEFDTQLPDLVMSGIKFYRPTGDTYEGLNLLTPGEVRATMDITANNNTDFDLLFALALYKGGELVSIDAEPVNVTSVKSEPVRSVTVPDDECEYTVKAFAWRNDNARPLLTARTLKETTTEPIAIIKLDDFGATSSLPIWESVAQWADDYGVKMSFGLMGYAINQDDYGKSHAAAVAKIANSPMIEVWSHGYNWETGYFTSTDEAVQANQFSESNRVAQEAGFEMHAFNPPSNGMNDVTVKVLNEQFTNYTTVMQMSSTEPSYVSDDNNFVTLWKRIETEAGSTSNTESVENLKTNWNNAKNKGYEYIVLQLHPNGWSRNKASQERFYEFVLWLQNQGVVFMTPSEYTAYIKG